MNMTEDKLMRYGKVSLQSARLPCGLDYSGRFRDCLEECMISGQYERRRTMQGSEKIMLSDDPDVSEIYTREIIPGGCRKTDPATGEYEDFSCIMCQGGQPGTCDDYSKAQELLENAKVMQQEVGFDLERLEKIAKEEYDGHLSMVYSHDHWETTLKNGDGKKLKAAAPALHEVVKNLISEYQKECEIKFRQILRQKLEAMDGSEKLNKPLSELRQKISGNNSVPSPQPSPPGERELKWQALPAFPSSSGKG